MACSKRTAPAHHRAPTPPPPCRSGELRLTHQGILAGSGAAFGVNHNPENFSLSPTWPLLDRVTGCCRAQGPPQWRRTPPALVRWAAAGVGKGGRNGAPDGSTLVPRGPWLGPPFQGPLTSCLHPGSGEPSPLENPDGLGLLLCIKMAPAAAPSLAARFSRSLTLTHPTSPARHFALFSTLPLHPTPVSRLRHGRAPT